MLPISIIIPTYNAASTLANALQSLKDQTFQGFEIVIQDNCSADETLAIAGKYKSFFQERLQIVSELDYGIYDGMNKAIQKANGEWLYFLGSDDYLMDNAVLNRLQPYFGNKRIDFLYGNVNSPDYGERYDGEFNAEKIERQNICHQAIFYRRNVFAKLGLYDTKYKVCADWDMNNRCFIHPKIGRQYVDVTIAYFEQGGFGKKYYDELYISTKHIVNRAYMKRFAPFAFWTARARRLCKRLLLNTKA
jgi:glycosyltransferase involved in cell wall biosynthesis